MRVHLIPDGKDRPVTVEMPHAPRVGDWLWPEVWLNGGKRKRGATVQAVQNVVWQSPQQVLVMLRTITQAELDE